MTVRKVSVKKPGKHKVRVKRRKGSDTPAPVFSDATEDSGSTDDSASDAPAPKKKAAPKKATAKKRTAKKSATKKAPAKKAVTPKKAAAKKTAAKPKKKADSARRRKAVDPAPAKKERKPRKKPVREEGPGGYLAGSNSAIAVEEMLKGGSDRAEVGRRIVSRCSPTRQGHPVNASGMISALLLQLEDQGYTVESHWVLKEPTPQSKAAATRRKNAREKKAKSK